MNNTEKGKAFARRVGEYLRRSGPVVEREYAVDIGFGTRRRESHHFDFGNGSLLVECKHINFVASGNPPSATIATLNEAILYFLAAPPSYGRKRLVLAKTKKLGVQHPNTLAEFYVRLRGHLIPSDIEVWKLCSDTLDAKRIDC